MRERMADGGGREGGEALDPVAVRLLAEVAEVGSLSAAGARLGMSQPTAGRRLKALEEAVGQALVARHGRGVALTEAGLELVHAAREVAQAMGRFELLAGALGRQVGGQVRVSASEPVAAELLPWWVACLRREHPGVQVVVVAENRVSDVAHREVDLAVRMFRPTRGDLVAVRVGASPMALFAAGGYVAARGAPVGRADFAHHDAVGFDRDPVFNEAFRAITGDLPPERIVLRTDAHGPSLGAIRAGVGVGAVQRVIARRYPELVEVAPEVQIPPLEVWLVTHRDLRQSRLVRTAFGHLRGWLTELLAAEVTPD